MVSFSLVTAVVMSSGWVQELDGEPGDVSAWYREKGLTNLPGHISNFKDLGLKMFAFTNTFNC